MKRAGYIATVKTEGIDEYKRYHADVWPEMRDALKRAGFQKFTIFMRPNGVTFAYCEVEESLAKAFENVGKEEVNARWGEVMARKRPDTPSVEQTPRPLLPPKGTTGLSLGTPPRWRASD